MADIATSVLTRLKSKTAEAIRSTYSSFVRRNFCADWKNPNTRKALS